jgi:plastocyanin
MAVHQLYIKKETFEPAELRIQSGDQVVFQLSGRDDEAVRVWEAHNEPLDGEIAFMVGKNGKPKTLVTREKKTYEIRTMKYVPPDELKVSEQTGSMGGKIIVMP